MDITREIIKRFKTTGNIEEVQDLARNFGLELSAGAIRRLGEMSETVGFSADKARDFGCGEEEGSLMTAMEGLAKCRLEDAALQGISGGKAGRTEAKLSAAVKGI